MTTRSDLQSVRRRSAAGRARVTAERSEGSPKGLARARRTEARRRLRAKEETAEEWRSLGTAACAWPLAQVLQQEIADPLVHHSPVETSPAVLPMLSSQMTECWADLIEGSWSTKG